LLYAAKSQLNAEYDLAMAQSVLAMVQRAYFLSFSTYDLSRRVSDSCMEMVELQERLDHDASETLQRQELDRRKRTWVLKQQREGIKSRLRNARPESDAHREARLRRAMIEKRFSKIAKQRRKDGKKREVYITSGQWIARTSLSPRAMSLFM
jgi:hypothetical protein